MVVKRLGEMLEECQHFFGIFVVAAVPAADPYNAGGTSGRLPLQALESASAKLPRGKRTPNDE